MLKVLSVLGYLAMMGGLIGLLLTRSLLSASPFVIVPQVAAVALVIWARITFGRRSFHLAANPTAGGLVTTGPYRYIRHPIYTGVCLFVTAGTTALAAIAIGRSGFQPLSKTIEETRKLVLLRWAEKLFPDEYKKLSMQFQEMVRVNFFPVSELALVHTEQRGGQGICETIKPLIEKLLAHPDLIRERPASIALNQFLDEITMTQQSFPVVFAVELRDFMDRVTWNPQGAYQIEGTVSPRKIRAILVAPRFTRFDVIDRKALLKRAQDVSTKHGHFAYDVRIQTMRQSVGVQPRFLL